MFSCKEGQNGFTGYLSMKPFYPPQVVKNQRAHRSPRWTPLPAGDHHFIGKSFTLNLHVKINAIFQIFRRFFLWEARQIACKPAPGTEVIVTQSHVWLLWRKGWWQNDFIPWCVYGLSVILNWGFPLQNECQMMVWMSGRIHLVVYWFNKIPYIPKSAWDPPPRGDCSIAPGHFI